MNDCRYCSDDRPAEVCDNCLAEMLATQGREIECLQGKLAADNARWSEAAKVKADLDDAIERLQHFVGDEMLRSDFRTAAEMRAEIERLREALTASAETKAAYIGVGSKLQIKDDEIERLQAENRWLDSLIVRDTNDRVVTQGAFNAMMRQNHHLKAAKEK